MDIYETRVENLKAALAIAGSSKELAELTGVDASYISQCLSPKIKKNMGPVIAKRIEKALGFEDGWMDTQHQQQESTPDSSLISLNLLIEQLDDNEKDDLSELVYMMIRRRKIVSKYD